MKIGLYDPYLDTMSGGERYMLSIATCLADSHAVSVFWDPKQEATIRDEAKRKFAMDLKKVTFTPSLFTPRTSLLKRFTESSKYDRIFVLSDGSIPLLGCPLILHFQSPVEWVQPNDVLTRIKLKRTKKFICNSEFTKHFIDRKFHIRSAVLYPPVTFFSPTGEKKEKLILNVGRFGINEAGSSYKKQDVLVTAFRKLQLSGGRGWRLVLVVSTGEEQADALKQFIKTTADLPITVLVNPDQEKLNEMYEKASLYWHAAGFGEDLTTHPDRAEHFGLSTVEAMHAGAVPVVIRAGGQPEIVKNGESGFLWETIEELVAKSNELIGDEALRKRLMKQAVERAESFSIDHFCQEVTEIIT